MDTIEINGIALNDNYQVATVNGRAVSKRELTEVFNSVCDPTNWKLPIDKTILLGQGSLAMVTEAVIFFTGSVPTFEPIKPLRRNRRRLGAYSALTRYRIRAAGYYKTIGA